MCLWRLRRAAVFETTRAPIAIESVPEETRRLREEDNISFSGGDPNEGRGLDDAEEELAKARQRLEEAEQDLALVELVTSGADDATLGRAVVATRRTARRHQRGQGRSRGRPGNGRRLVAEELG